MARRRGRLCSRLARIEDRTGPAGDDQPQVTVYRPRTDGDPQPCGVVSEDRSRVVLYDADLPDTILPPAR